MRKRKKQLEEDYLIAVHSYTEVNDTLTRYEVAISGLLEDHCDLYIQRDRLPTADTELADDLPVWCRKCSTEWPCEPFKVLRQVCVDVHGFDEWDTSATLKVSK